MKAKHVLFGGLLFVGCARQGERPTNRAECLLEASKRENAASVVMAQEICDDVFPELPKVFYVQDSADTCRQLRRAEGDRYEGDGSLVETHLCGPKTSLRLTRDNSGIALSCGSRVLAHLERHDDGTWWNDETKTEVLIESSQLCVRRERERSSARSAARIPEVFYVADLDGGCGQIRRADGDKYVGDVYLSEMCRVAGESGVLLTLDAPGRLAFVCNGKVLTLTRRDDGTWWSDGAGAPELVESGEHCLKIEKMRKSESASPVDQASADAHPQP